MFIKNDYEDEGSWQQWRKELVADVIYACWAAAVEEWCRGWWYMEAGRAHHSLGDKTSSGLIYSGVKGPVRTAT